MSPAKPNENQSLIECLDELGDSISLDDSEVKRIIKDAGVDIKSGLHKAMLLVEAAKARALQDALKSAKAERIPILERLDSIRPAKTRGENIAFIRSASQTLSLANRPQAFHRNFESATDEDIESLATEIEVLLAMTKK